MVVFIRDSSKVSTFDASSVLLHRSREPWRPTPGSSVSKTVLGRRSPDRSSLFLLYVTAFLEPTPLTLFSRYTFAKRKKKFPSWSLKDLHPVTVSVTVRREREVFKKTLWEYCGDSNFRSLLIRHGFVWRIIRKFVFAWLYFAPFCIRFYRVWYNIYKFRYLLGNFGYFCSFMRIASFRQIDIFQNTWKKG